MELRTTHGPTLLCSYGALASLVIALLLGREYTFDWRAPYVLSLAYLAILGSVVTFACWLTLVGRIGVPRQNGAR